MSKITRYNGDLRAFASGAIGTERTIFGDVIQSDALDDNITLDFLRGWGIVGVNENPTKQDFNALGYTLSQLLAYLHQQGVAEWNTSQEYHIGGAAMVAGRLFLSRINTNIGNDPAIDDGTNWLPLGQIVVPDIATLRTITPVTGQTLDLQRHTIGIDGGGGQFVALTGSPPGTYVDDDGVTIVPTGGDGSSCWRRQDSETINVTWFGASPSATAPVNDAAFNAALLTGAGKSVYVPPGIYLKSAACEIYPFTTFFGDGQASRLQSTVDVEMVYNSANDGTTSDERIQIHSLFLRRVLVTHAATKHIRLNSAVRNKIWNVEMSDQFFAPTITTQGLGGVWFEKSGAAETLVNWVDSCLIEHGEVILECTDSKITRNYIWSHGSRTCIRVLSAGNVIIGNDILPSPIDGGIYCGSSAFGTQISNNNFDGSYEGVLSGTGVLSQAAYGTTITNNYFYWIKKDGVILRDQLNSVVSGNTFKDGNRSNSAAVRGLVAAEALVINNAAGYATGAGIVITVDATTEDLWIGDVINFTGGGIFTLTVSAARGATSVTGDLTVLAVADNEKGYKEYSDVVLQSTSIGCLGNIVSGNTHWIIEARLANGNAVLEADRGAASSINSLTGSFVRSTGYNTPAVVRSNTTTGIRGNRGGGSASYLSGTATVVNGTSSITVNHGSNYLPKTHEITLTPTSQLVTATSWIITNVTATTFDITTNVNVGANFNVAWAIDIP